MSENTDHDELVKKLDKEGDIAADYLEELLDIADLDGDIDIAVEADRAAVAVVTEGGADRRLRRLIGKDGEVLDALQELTRLAVQTATGERSRLMLDIDKHRANHREEIAELARDVVREVKEDNVTIELEPMNAFERKVVHDVAAEAGLYSDSEGVGPDRHVVVHPEPPVEDTDEPAEDEPAEDEANEDGDA